MHSKSTPPQANVSHAFHITPILSQETKKKPSYHHRNEAENQRGRNKEEVVIHTRYLYSENIVIEL